MLYGSAPIEVRERSVLLEVGDERVELPNDCVWIFAGGTPPSEFLERAGIRTGARDLMEEASGAQKNSPGREPGVLSGRRS